MARQSGVARRPNLCRTTFGEKYENQWPIEEKVFIRSFSGFNRHTFIAGGYNPN
jgi:hypothetical protein